MSEAKIIPIGLAKPVEEVIDELKMLLGMAEKGELRSLTWCGEGGGNVYSGFTTGTDIWSTIGHIERIKHRLLINADDRTEHEIE